ncbi:ribosomal RNA processing protein 1 homolog B [Lissotriton helveticus]
MAAPALSAPLILAQKLADNEPRGRQQAVRRLRKYLRARSRGQAVGFSEDELTKIWKGLFYCMWMQDKPLLQEDLANTISQLMHALMNTDAQLLFLKTFWQTMNREWNGIDRLRLDKFYTLCRLLLREAFQVLKKNKWEDSLVEPFLELLTKELLHSESQSPNGVRYHLLDIYLEELAKVGSEELLAEQNLKFIEPFCKTAAKTKDHHLMQAIARGIFETIVEQAPFAIEELVKELKQNRNTSEDDETEEESEEEEAAQSKNKSRKRKFVKEENLLLEEDDFEKDEDQMGNIGPVLQFDYSAIADRLFQLSSKKFTPPQNRKRLYRLVNKFRNLAEGIFPQDDFPEDVSTDEDDDDFSQKWSRRKHFRALKNKAELEKAKEKDSAPKRSAEEDGASAGPPKKKKKRKKRKAQDANLLASLTSEEGTSAAGKPGEVPPDNEPGASKGKLTTSTIGDLLTCENNNNCNTIVELVSDSPKTLQKKKKVLSSQEPGETQLQNGLVTNDAPEVAITSTRSKPKKKKKSTLLQQAGQSVVQATQVVCQTSAPSKPKKKVKHLQDTTGSTLAEGSSTQAEGEVTITTAKPKKVKCPVLNGNAILSPASEEGAKDAAGEDPDSRLPLPKQCKLKTKQKLLKRTEALLAISSLRKKKRKLKESASVAEVNGSPVCSSKKSKRSVLDDDTFVPLVTKPVKKAPKVETDFVKFEKVTPPKPAFVRNNKGSLSGVAGQKQMSQLTDSGNKKVTFGLSNNMTAEFKKTDKSILVSPGVAPRVAFNPEQKPLHGVLKTPPLGSTPGSSSKKKVKKRTSFLCTPTQKQGTAFSTPTQKRPTTFSTPPKKKTPSFSTPIQKQGVAFSPIQKKGSTFSTPTRKKNSAFSSPTQKHSKPLTPKSIAAVSTPTQKRAKASDYF